MRKTVDIQLFLTADCVVFVWFFFKSSFTVPPESVVGVGKHSNAVNEDSDVVGYFGVVGAGFVEFGAEFGEMREGSKICVSKINF